MKSKLLLVLTLMSLTFSNSYSQQDVNGWYWLNGKPTGNTLNWVKVIDAATIYAVGAYGSFLKSVDGGDTWSINSQVGTHTYPAADYLTTLTLYTGWFFDANTGIVAGQSTSLTAGKISRTTDGGNTWTYIQYNDTGGTVKSICFINSLTGYLTGSGRARFFKTTDGGLSWQDKSFSPLVPAETYSGVFATDTSNIYLTAESNPIKKVYYHKPGMDSAWKVWNLGGTFSVLADITFKDANTGYICGNPNYFAYTTNAGTNWTQSNAPSTVGQRDLKYEGGIIYMAGDYQNIYKSSDNGVTWSSIYFYDLSNPNQPPINSPAIIYGIDVNGSNISVVGQNGIVNISNDGGNTWRNKNYSVTNSANSTLYSSIFVQTTGSAAFPVAGKIWLGPNQGGNIYYSSNAGANWTTKPSPNVSTVKKIQFVDANTGYICGGNSFNGIGEMSKTTNGGNTWTALSLPSPINSLAIWAMSFVNANTGYIGSEGGYSAKTINGGASWTLQTLEPSTFYTVRNIQMLDANTGYAIASSLYKTTNGGTNWIKTTNPYILSNSWNYFYLYSKDIIFLSGTGATNKIVRSVDGGNTFTDLTSNLVSTFTPWKTNWINLKHGVACGVGGIMAKTTNGGLSWDQSNPGGSTTVDQAFPNKNEWYTVSDRNSAYEVWRKYDNLTSISVNVTMGIEGFWDGTTMITDSVTVELRNNTFPFAAVDVATEVVSPYGYSTYEFYNAPAGSYYVVLKHRNSIETWSAAPVTMIAAGNYNYNFTTSASQSYGNNEVYKSGINCVYSGDINQDGTIDAADLSLAENAALIGLSGYVPEDVTGDDYVDAGDLAIVENNAGFGITIAQP